MVGQPGAGIASTMLSDGRTATVTGIVRGPYPNATDRRFAVTPRFPADVRVAGRTPAGSAAGGGPISGSVGGNTPSSSDDPGAAADTAVDAPPDADLVDLDVAIGHRVRVGGLVVDLRPDGFTLDDGTAVGQVVLRAAALERLGLIEPDDAVNAIGQVEMTADGPIVVVEDPGGIIEAGDPVAGAPSGEPSPAPAVVDPSGDPGAFAGGRYAGLTGAAFPLDASLPGLASLLAISAASIAVTLLRREQARRRMAARIAARLATFAGRPTAPPDAIPAERGPSTSESA